MAFSKGKTSLTLDEILKKVTEGDILSYYLGIKEIPCVINSPLRTDTHPSFGFRAAPSKRIYWKDFATQESGGVFDLLQRMWNCNIDKVIDILNQDFKNMTKHLSIKDTSRIVIKTKEQSSIDLQCKVREWRDYDIKYWESYGISLKWLKYAEVYPVSHKIIFKDNQKYTFGADKYAYVYVERKEGKTSLKIYQPYNKEGFKWSNSHDGSVIGLWAKLPQYGDKVCICSSLKDALCLWANMNIPSVCLQGEGYSMSNTAINELKRRFKKVYILLDNDETGITDSIKLANQTGFINVVLPFFKEGKDISDLYKSAGYLIFNNIIYNLFKDFDYDENRDV